MGWFDEQIRSRRKRDQQTFEDSFATIAGSVSNGKYSPKLKSSRLKSLIAIGSILEYYGARSQEVPDNITKLDEQLEYLLRPYGIMYRTVTLEEGWHKNAAGPMLATRKSDSSPVALIPSGFSGYSFTSETGQHIRVTKENEGDFEAEAMYFYRAFPIKQMDVRSLIRYIFDSLSTADIVLYALACLAVTFVGLITPWIYFTLFNDVLPIRDTQILVLLAVFTVCTVISRALLLTARNLLLSRISTKVNLSVQAAAMMRVLILPAEFFRNYSAGELASRVQSLNTLCTTLISTFLSASITTIFSIIYIIEIGIFVPTLVLPAIGVILLTLLYSLLLTFAKTKQVRRHLQIETRESGMNYTLLSGIQKIKLTGSEQRAFSRWGAVYAEKSKIVYNPPALIRLGEVIGATISFGGTILLYYYAAHTAITAAQFFAFSAAYAMVSSAFVSLADSAGAAASITPALEQSLPILQAVPEISEAKHVISRLSGAVELSHVTFRYNENSDAIIDDLSLRIPSGQYVAVVGKTGCGKSTLMRLLLAFEQPQKGAIYYDGKDLNNIDLKSLRQRIGVVMQDDKLMAGDIYSNIAISVPGLSMEDAWDAAEKAGLADDIRAMPMGMFTMISEGNGGISGGQKQRIAIARAIAPKPKILMFDEATSALDNLTQKQVSAALDSLKCTRIVIAHRLSTIRQCDRILLLENGRIIEDGTYDALIAKNGAFAELVERQRLDQ